MRLLLGAFAFLFEFGEEELGELGVDRMAGARCDDVRLERHAEKHNVANDIEDLVANELVLKAEAFLGENLVALDDDGAVERAALDLAELEQLLDVLVNRERARGGDLRHIDVGVDREREMLRVNATVVGRGAGDLEFIAGQRDDRRVATRDGNGLFKNEIFAVLVLLDRVAADDEINEGFGGTVHDGRLGGVDLDKHVVDAAAAKGAEHMLDEVDLGVAVLHRGVADEIADQLDAGLDLGMTA